MTNSSQDKQRSVEDLFVARFGDRKERIVVKSPGRINLLGEHTDYNEGFVLPAAVNKAVWFVTAPRNDREFRFVAADLREEFECSVGSLHHSAKGWPNYLMGVIGQVAGFHGDLRGCDVVFGGDIPIGAGLSSSAAIECGFAYSLDSLYSLGIERLELVRMCQRAEHDFVGVRCGIMDQFTNVFGQEKSVLKLDCRSLECEYVPYDHDTVCFVLFDSGIRRRLSTSEYNERRSECEAGVAVLSAQDETIKSLRDVNMEVLERYQGRLDPLVNKRCAYVVRENARVLSARDALQRGDLISFGELMFRSHADLRDEFEVSTPELDLLVEVAARVPGTLGARMMGGGFGGCTISLVEKRHREELLKAVQTRYKKATGREVKPCEVQIDAGTHRVKNSRPAKNRSQVQPI